jgi:hypothetical protein
MRRTIALVVLLAACVGGATQTRDPEFEKVPPGEPALIQEIAADAVAELKKRYPDPGTMLVRRDAHAKAHGCVKAVFQVDPAIPAALRVGTFAQPGQRYKALVRFSNGSFEPGPDSHPDGRGMAVKLIDADPDAKSMTTRNRPPHDIIMIDYPVFFLGAPEEYIDFIKAGALNGDPSNFKRYFFPGYDPFHWHIRQAYIANRTANQEIDSPLRISYFSMTPYAFGPGRAVKYSARPCGIPSPVAAVQAKSDPDFLKAALQSELSSAPACFELMVQERRGNMDIEDASADWPESVSPFQPVGRIEILPRRMNSAEKVAACENLSFNPGNAPEDLRPLGGINRARRVVYERVAKYRMDRNKTTATDPSTAWDQF